MPRDEIYLKIYPSTEKFSKKSYLFTCDDVHDEEEEGGTDSPGGGGHDLHDHREQDGEPGLRKQVVQGWRIYSYLYCVDISASKSSIRIASEGS